MLDEERATESCCCAEKGRKERLLGLLWHCVIGRRKNFGVLKFPKH